MFDNWQTNDKSVFTVCSPVCGIGLLFFNQETDETPSGEQEASTKHSYVESDNQKKK